MLALEMVIHHNGNVQFGGIRTSEGIKIRARVEKITN